MSGGSGRNPSYPSPLLSREREMALSLCEPQWLRPFLEENGRELPFLRKQSLTPSWIMSVLIKMSLGVTSWITQKDEYLLLKSKYKEKLTVLPQKSQIQVIC